MGQYFDVRGGLSGFTLTPTIENILGFADQIIMKFNVG
jgi:hypothetical protein